MATDCGGTGTVTVKSRLGAVLFQEDCPGCSHPGCPARPGEGETVSEELTPNFEEKAWAIFRKLWNDGDVIPRRFSATAIQEEYGAALKAEYERGHAADQADQEAAVEEGRRREREACLAELQRRIAAFDSHATEKHLEGNTGYAEDLEAKSLGLYRFSGWMEKRARSQREGGGS